MGNEKQDGVKIFIDVQSEAIGGTTRLGRDEDPAIGKLGAVVGDIEYLDDARIGCRFNDVHLGFVGREREAIRPVDVAGNNGGAARLGIEPVDVGGQLGSCHMAFVVAEDAERRIGEPDGVVGFDHHVVG